MEYKKLVIEEGTSHDVELLFDQPKPLNTNWGEKFLYGVKKGGEEYSFFATPYLNTKLSGFKRGDVVKIANNKVDGKTVWDVRAISVNKMQGNQKIESMSNGVVDARTHDIHKQVCLKLAIQMRGNTDKMLTDADLVIIEANMKHLLNILEGTSVSEEMPF